MVEEFKQFNARKEGLLYILAERLTVVKYKSLLLAYRGRLRRRVTRTNARDFEKQGTPRTDLYVYNPLNYSRYK